MGSPQYGRLILDGRELVTAEPGGVEHESLVWSAGRTLLAVQELAPAIPYPGRRVIVIDADRRVQIAASQARKGLSTPIRFEGDTLIYRHWAFGPGEQELRLAIDKGPASRY